MRIKQDDVVTVTCGAGRGKNGKVLQVIDGGRRVIVEGVNVVKKTMRKTQEMPQGGIHEKEAPIAISNVSLYCATCKRGVRVSGLRDGNKPVRKCKRCGHVWD